MSKLTNRARKSNIFILLWFIYFVRKPSEDKVGPNLVGLFLTIKRRNMFQYVRNDEFKTYAPAFEQTTSSGRLHNCTLRVYLNSAGAKNIVLFL